MALTRLCPFCLEPERECACLDPDDHATPAGSPAGEGDALYHIGHDGPQCSAPASVEVLRTPATGAAVPLREEPDAYRGVIIITWPAPYGASPYSSMTGRLAEITDALTGKPIRTCTGLTVSAGTECLVTADLIMFADADGGPLLDGEPVTDGGEIRTGVFPFLVSEMRVRAK